MKELDRILEEWSDDCKIDNVHLDETSRKAQLEKQAAEADNVQKAMANMPMLIYIM